VLLSRFLLSPGQRYSDVFAVTFCPFHRIFLMPLGGAALYRRPAGGDSVP